jgi:hypothetical protein
MRAASEGAAGPHRSIGPSATGKKLVERTRLCFVSRVQFPVLWAAAALSLNAAGALTNPPTAGVRVPIEFRRGDLLLPVRVNDTQSLRFKLDTGFGVSTIHPDWVDVLQLRPVGRLRIEGIAGDESATVYNGLTFDLGGATYSPRRLAVVPSDSQRRRRDRDGILGEGFFRRFVVEIEPRARTLTLHEPRAYRAPDPAEVIPLEFRRDTPIVNATIGLTNREPIPARFEIDTGCDGELCLGSDFVAAHSLEEAAGVRRNGSRIGVGGSVNTRIGVLPQFQLGAVKMEAVTASFFESGSPVDNGHAGHIGLGLLRRFKVTFDYSRRQMILEPLP